MLVFRKTNEDMLKEIKALIDKYNNEVLLTWF